MHNKPKIPRNIVLVGLTSFFTDVSSEMVYPLLQAFVSMIMSSQKALLGPVLGIIEGVAESTASLLKVFVGYYSDRIQNRKTPTIAGYGISSVGKALLLLSSLGWYFVLFSRFLDRIGKGVRTAPRDAIISESTPGEIAGKAFGFHRAMDFGGATLGVLICYFLSVRYLDPVTKTLRNVQSFYLLFALSIIPAAIGVVFLFFLQERPLARAHDEDRPGPSLNFRKCGHNLQLFFLVSLLFTLGNSSNQFLLLRSMSLGYALSTVILMYMVFNLVTSFLATPFGSLSDRIGPRTVLILGYLVYAGVYMSFGLIGESNKELLWGFWILYAIHYAMTEGVEKAFVCALAPAESKATALGFFHTVVGVSLLPASMIAGFLFSIHPAAPFLFGGGMAALAVLVLALFVRDEHSGAL